MRKLTPKQEMFVAEYLKDLNATQAAIRAGYSEKYADKIGSDLLRKSGVSEAIEKAKAKRVRRIEVNADWVVKKLIRNRRKSDEAGQYSATNKALELLGKHVGMFADRLELSGPKGGPIPVADMTDAELARIAATAADSSDGSGGTVAPPAGTP